MHCDRHNWLSNTTNAPCPQCEMEKQRYNFQNSGNENWKIRAIFLDLLKSDKQFAKEVKELLNSAYLMDVI